MASASDIVEELFEGLPVVDVVVFDEGGVGNVIEFQGVREATSHVGLVGDKTF